MARGAFRARRAHSVDNSQLLPPSTRVAAPVRAAPRFRAVAFGGGGRGMAGSATLTIQATMIGNLRPASDEEIERLLANPDEITRLDRKSTRLNSSHGSIS